MPEVVAIVFWVLVGVGLAALYMEVRFYRRLRELECAELWLRKIVSALNNDAALTRFLVRGDVPEGEQYAALSYLQSNYGEGDSAEGQR